MTDRKPPVIENTPGIIWRMRVNNRWAAVWQARTDLVKRGYKPTKVALWTGEELTEKDRQWISDRCNALQSEMLVWGRGGIQFVSEFDGTIRSLIVAYERDPDSTYQKIRFWTRQQYDSLLRRIMRDHGEVKLADIKGRDLKRWHEAWAADGKVALAHALVGQLRTLFTFGFTMLDNAECGRIKLILHSQKFAMSKPRTERMTADQAIAFRKQAHKEGLHSLAMAQAFQFGAMLRQKDVIGEYVPLTEPGVSDIIIGNSKWLRGLRWEEIDDALVLNHVTSKRQKALEVPLRKEPMIMEELARIAGCDPAMITRAMLPATGPVIISERTTFPWMTKQYSRYWRKLATRAGIPKTIRNMDSRAGAITEATEAGAELEHVRHAATHGDIAMTQRYSRGAAEKIAKVMDLRAAHRNKTGS